MRLTLNVIFYDITEDERDYVIEWCHKHENDYNYLLDPLDGSIQVFEIDDKDLQQLKTLIS